MSYPEKSAWISLLSMSGIYAFYFWSVLHSGARAGGVHVSGLLETIIALAVVQNRADNWCRDFRTKRGEGASR
jgi:hypothetical protein